MVKIGFNKALASRFRVTSKSCSWINKIVHDWLSIKRTSCKGDDNFTKSRLDVEFVK